jgi:hypothetical protein
MAMTKIKEARLQLGEKVSGSFKLAVGSLQLASTLKLVNIQTLKLNCRLATDNSKLSQNSG